MCKNNYLKKVVCFILALSLFVVKPYTNTFIFYVFADSRTAIVKAVKVNVRSGPGTTYDILGIVNIGYSFTAIDVKVDASGKNWYRFNYNGKNGYIREDLIRFSNSYTYDATFEQMLSNQGFPEDYKVLLRQIHADFPNWRFNLKKINMDFAYAVSKELEGTRTLVTAGAISSYKSTDYGKYDYVSSKWPTFDGNAWVCASKEIIEYYMDPRNFLFDSYIFQFEKQTFNSNVHTLAGVTEMVKGTFLEGTINTNYIQNAKEATENLPFPQIVENLGFNNTTIPNITDNNVSNSAPYSEQTNNNTASNNSNNQVFSKSLGPGLDIDNSNNSSNSNSSNVIGSNVLPNSNSSNNTSSNILPSNNNSSNSNQNNSTLPYDITENEAYSYENYGPGIVNYNKPVIPMLSTDIKDDEIYSFSNVIIGPGANIANNSIQNNTSNIYNANNQYVEGSFKFNFLPAGTYTYADIIYNACAQVGINPYVVVAMIIQEQGKDGKTDSVSGKNTKYNGIYNYGNIGAYASNGLTAVENGLRYASEEGSYNRPWNSKEKALYGIVDYYANCFIKRGQDTFYLKKWNVQGDNLFQHQYMTNVQGAASEGQILGNLYDDTLRMMSHEFDILIYNNMLLTPAAIPTKAGSPNNWLKSLTVEGYTLTPTFDTNTNNYTLRVDSNVNKVKIIAEPYDKKATYTGTGNISLTVSNTIANINVVAENKDIKQYTITIYKRGAENVSLPAQNYDIVIPIIVGTFDTTITGPPSSQTNIVNNPSGIVTNNSNITMTPPIS